MLDTNNNNNNFITTDLERKHKCKCMYMPFYIGILSVLKCEEIFSIEVLG